MIEIAGLGKAAEVAEKGLEKWARQNRHVRDRLHNALALKIPGIRLNSHPEIRLPNTLSLSFPGVDAQAMLSGMKEVAASAGAACHADQVTVSGVLRGDARPGTAFLRHHPVFSRADHHRRGDRPCRRSDLFRAMTGSLRGHQRI
ncbi:MAG: aminotransferase class V-fold PLP-dependent enzyme [Sphingobacterium sp.]|nr:aminotransferase class V-fold PLP-dependent enzyme [Sphingobacterium sp.]